MSFKTSVVMIVMLATVTPVMAALYWDVDDGNAGATVGTSANGIWDTATKNWNINSDGSGANQSFVCGEAIIFSAGTDAVALSLITVCGTYNVSSLYFEEGMLTLSGGTINFDDATADIGVAVGLTATIASVITGCNGIILNGQGTVLLSGANTYTGDTIIGSGTIMLGVDNALPDNSDMILDGGTYDSNGYSDRMANLTLNADSIINLAGGNSVLHFATMNNNAGTLQIWNWDGLVGSPGGNDQLIFDVFFASGKISNIEFYNDDGNTFLANGSLYDLGNGSWELVASAVPEASTYVNTGLIVMVLLVHFNIKRARMRKLNL